MAQLFRWYSRMLNIHPWKVQLLTTDVKDISQISRNEIVAKLPSPNVAGFLMGSSDVIAQTAIEKSKINQIELPRIGRFAVLGTFFVAPVLRTWYNVLEKSIGTIGKTVGLRKMIVDQLLFTPCFLGCFLIVSGLLQLQPWKIIKTKIDKEYFSILTTNYMLWPAAQLVTFYVIPLQFRIIFVSFVALLWNTYLASQANRNYEI